MGNKCLIISATVTEKLGRHKLLLKKRKSQSGRASSESFNSDETNGGSRETQKLSSEIFASGEVPDFASELERQPIRLRQSNSISPVAPSSDRAGPSGARRLERLPAARGPAGLPTAQSRDGPGGVNRFAELLKNRREGADRAGEEANREVREKKTDVANLFQASRRPLPGSVHC